MSGSHIGWLIGLLLLLGVANGTPVFATALLGKRFGWPLDGGRSFVDGHPLLGAGKTWRGVAVSVACTTAVSWVFGFGAGIGAALALAAMAGDMAASFVKRRLRLPAHARAPGLDQIPEALLPLLLARWMLGLGWAELILLLALFVAGDVALSRLAFRLRLRDRPY